MERWFVLDNRISIFCYPPANSLGRILPCYPCGIILAYSNALAASHTLFIIDMRYFVFSDFDGVMSAVFLTYSAACAILIINMRRRSGMKEQFTSDRSASHPQIFQSSPESGKLMSLEMVHRNYNICIGNGRTYFG